MFLLPVPVLYGNTEFKGHVINALTRHQHGGRKPAKTSGVHFGYFKAFLLPAELSHIDIDVSITC